MTTKYLLLLTTILHGKTGVSQPPIIYSFSPASGPIGTTVIISGANFGSTPTDNIVYFGAVRAPVLEASSNTITVTAPAGSTYQPISVTTANLTAYSQLPFTVTFTGFVTNTSLPFDFRKDYHTGQIPIDLSLADLDGDFKTDIIASNYASNTLSIYRNTSIIGSLSFSSTQDIQTAQRPYGFSFGDLNGDGKLDLVVSNAHANTVSVFINRSEPGKILFNGRQDLNTGPTPSNVAIANLNLDGKPDLVITNRDSNIISVFKNTTENGIISFSPRQDFVTQSCPWTCTTADIDGDGNSDIIVTHCSSFTFSVFKNVSSNHDILLAPEQHVEANVEVSGIAASGDLDQDGKLDLVLGCNLGDTVSIFRNLSTGGAISFAPNQPYQIGFSPFGIALTDLDGDGDLEIATPRANQDRLTLLRSDPPPAINFVYTVEYTTGSHPGSIAIGDLDGDGPPDIVVANALEANVSVYRNQISDPLIVQLCPGSSTSFPPHLSDGQFQWQIDTGVGFQDIQDDENHSGASSNSLHLNAIPSSWYGYKYRLLVDGLPTRLFEIRFVNDWRGTSSNDWENPENWSCGSTPDQYTDVTIRNGSVVLHTNVSARSLTVHPGATFTITPGVHLTLTH